VDVPYSWKIFYIFMALIVSPKWYPMQERSHMPNQHTTMTLIRIPIKYNLFSHVTVNNAK